MSRKKHRRPHRKPPRIRRRTSPGTAPGTLRVQSDAPKPAIRLICYSRDSYEEQDIHAVERVREFLRPDAVTWVNVDGLGDVTTLERLSEIFGLHDLALEDVVNVHQRVKVDEYVDHLFIVLRLVNYADTISTEQLSMFLGSNFVLTFQEHAGDCFDPVRDRLRKARGRIRSSGSDYLAYTLIDAIVDSYFPIVDAHGERIERLDEQLVSAGHSPHLLETLHEIRTDLMTLRRAIRPLRDALIQLMPDPHSLVTESTQFHLRDCYDHTIQLMDLLDAYRDMCASLRDYYMAIANNRMNEIMKVLTIIATIFMPLSFIAGVYGMNFNTALPGNMPELNWEYGYVFAWVIMTAVGLGLLYFVWRKGWVTRGDIAARSNAMSDNSEKQ